MSSIRLAATAEADIPTPPTDKISVFADADNGNQPSYKDDTGTVTSLQGAAGPGVPAGGTTGQVLEKIDGTDYNTQWVTPTTGSGDVTGPGSSTDGNFALFDGSSGDTIKDGGTPGAMAFEDDAPSDGTGYVRKDGAWASESGGGMTNPMTTAGDIIYGGSGGTPTRLAAGTNSYVLTMVSGAPAWAAAGGGGVTGFTTALNTSSPNGTYNVSSITASGGTTSQDIAIVPKGALGSVLAAIPDGTTTGGNKRGVCSVDLQLERSANTQVASAQYSALIGGRNNTNSGSYSGIVGGDGNSVTATYSFATGYQCSVTGNYSIALGRSCTASSTYTFAIGQSCTASGAYSVAMGGSHTASGVGSAAFGQYGTANANYSVATGLYPHVRGIIGARAHSAERAGGTKTDTQCIDYVFGALTTNATPAAATANVSSASTNNQVILPNNTAMIVRADVIARSSGGDVKSWETRATVKRGANAASTALVGTAVVTVCDADTGASTWTVGITADTTNGGLTYTVTGQSSTTITWAVIPRGAETVG